MPAQRVHAATSPPHVAHQQLQYRCGTDDLRAEAVMRPADRINNRRYLLRVSILTHRREQVRSLHKLILRYAGDTLHDFRRVPRVMLLQELVNASWILQRQVEIDGRR